MDTVPRLFRNGNVCVLGKNCNSGSSGEWKGERQKIFCAAWNRGERSDGRSQKMKLRRYPVSKLPLAGEVFNLGFSTHKLIRNLNFVLTDPLIGEIEMEWVRLVFEHASEIFNCTLPARPCQPTACILPSITRQPLSSTRSPTPHPRGNHTQGSPNSTAQAPS